MLAVSEWTKREWTITFAIVADCALAVMAWKITRPRPHMRKRPRRRH